MEEGMLIRASEIIYEKFETNKDEEIDVCCFELNIS